MNSLRSIAMVGMVGACITLTGCPKAWWWLRHHGGGDGGRGGGAADAGSGVDAGMAEGGSTAGAGSAGDAGSATDAGSAVDAGSSEQACGSRGLPPCPEGEYCNFPESAQCGDADAPGVCTPKPTACSDNYDAVCGCHGLTYYNPCIAASYGVSVRHAGPCEPAEPRPCTGPQQCNTGEHCYFPMCGAAESADGGTAAVGECMAFHEECGSIAYVCGCDGNRYANGCEATTMGAAVATPPGGSGGPCAAGVGNRCSAAPGSSPCAAGQYCFFGGLYGLGCHDEGRCFIQPTACTQEYDPVCSCDGTTYGNACMAAAAGASVRATGECP